MNSLEQIVKLINDLILACTIGTPKLVLSEEEMVGLSKALLIMNSTIDQIAERKTRHILDVCKTIMWNVYSHCEKPKDKEFTNLDVIRAVSELQRLNEESQSMIVLGQPQWHRHETIDDKIHDLLTKLGD